MKLSKLTLVLSALTACSLLISCENSSQTPTLTKNESRTDPSSVYTDYLAADSPDKALNSSSLDNAVSKNNNSLQLEDYHEKMQSIIDSYPFDCSVIVHSIDKGDIFTYNTKEKMYAASTIKLAYAYFCCTQIENGVHSLDETMIYSPEVYSDGSGEIQYMPYGTKLSVKQLLEYTMKYSDNVGYNMLIRLFGTDGFNRMMQDWGYDINITFRDGYDSVTAEMLKDFMLKLLNKKSDGESWKIVWNALNNSTDSIIREEINSAGDIAVKYGTVEFIYHEVCYIASDSPYILVVMTITDKVDEGDEKLFKSIANCANEMAVIS